MCIRDSFNRLQTENKSKIMELYRSGNKEELAVLRDTLIGKTELEAEKRKDETKMPSELRETYKTIGGVPFLDNQYKMCIRDRSWTNTTRRRKSA